VFGLLSPPQPQVGLLPHREHLLLQIRVGENLLFALLLIQMSEVVLLRAEAGQLPVAVPSESVGFKIRNEHSLVGLCPSEPFFHFVVFYLRGD